MGHFSEGEARPRHVGHVCSAVRPLCRIKLCKFDSYRQYIVQPFVKTPTMHCDTAENESCEMGNYKMQHRDNVEASDI